MKISKKTLIRIIITLAICALCLVITLKSSSKKLSIESTSDSFPLTNFTIPLKSLIVNLMTIPLQPVDNTAPELVVKEVTIKDTEKYSIDNFIESFSDDSNGEVKVYFKDETMGAFKDAGAYDIIIVASNESGNVTEKATKLFIMRTVKEVPNDTVKKEINNVPQKETKKLTFEEQVLIDTKKLGTAGRLYFPNMWSVAIYEVDRYVEGDAQKIVDEKDSAAHYELGNTMIIADHNGQGFDIIKGVNVGDIIYVKILQENGTVTLQRYRALEKIQGQNEGYTLKTDDGRIVGVDIDADLVTYTCNGKNPQYVTFVMWEKMGC